MLELRDYPLGVLENLIETRGKQATDRKLDAYGYSYTSKGTGTRRVYTITALPDAFHQFRFFCIFTLGFSPQTNFKKLRDFVYCILGDDDFAWRPDEMMEEYLRAEGRGMSRQTIAKYKRKLQENNIIDTIFGDFVYYRVYKDYGVQRHEIVTKEEYSRAWRLYWEWRNTNPDEDSSRAYAYMYSRFNGVPRKHRRTREHPWYQDLTNQLFELATLSIYEEVAD